MALAIGIATDLALKNAKLARSVDDLKSRLDELQEGLSTMKSDLKSTKVELRNSKIASEGKDDAIKELRVANEELRKQNLFQRHGLTDDERQMLHRSSLVESKLDDLRRYHELVAEILNIYRPSVDEDP